MNLAKSDPGDLPTVKSQTVTFLSDTPKKLTFHEVWIDSKGKAGSASFNGPEDGAVHPFMRSKVKGSFTPAGTGRFIDEDGGVSDIQLALAPDSKTLTMTSVYKAKDGSEHHLKDVFDRVK